MSLAPASPLISDWVKLKLPWKYLWQPTYKPLTVPANNRVQIPLGQASFNYPEGVVLAFGASFDSSDCGIQYETGGLDTRNVITVDNITSLGTLNDPFFIFASQPPQNVQGVHYVANYKEWVWTEWCKLYLLNTGPVDHICYNFFYVVAVLLSPRLPDFIECLEIMKMRAEIDPEFKTKLDAKLLEFNQTALLKRLTTHRAAIEMKGEV